MIELLTVIAIIGILAAILIPVVGKVRESARAAICMSNLRQVTVAMLMYADDNNGVIPTAGGGLSRRSDWIQWRDDGEDHVLQDSALVPYLGGAFDPEIFRCPSDENINNDEHYGYPYSYTMNIAIAPRRRLGGRVQLVENPTHLVMLVEEERPNDDAAFLGGAADNLTRRHNDQGHVSFFDGHVELTHPSFPKHPANYDPFYTGRPYLGPR